MDNIHNIHNMMKDNVVIIIGILLLVIIIMTIVIIVKDKKDKKHFKNDMRKNTDDDEDVDVQVVLKYFGCNTCPHSCKGSRAHNIVKLFEDIYDDVKVEYYWSNDNSSLTAAEFDRAGVDSVPTLTNCNYDHIELDIPKNIDRDKKTVEELHEILLTNIYAQL